LHKPLRMCISCRKRFYQFELLRLQCIDKQIVFWTKKGRSFYLCRDCLEKEKKVLKALQWVCKNKNDKYLSILKEIVNKWKIK